MPLLGATTTILLLLCSVTVLAAAEASTDHVSPWLTPGILIIIAVIITPLLSYFLYSRRGGSDPDAE
ncbi:hypothetical protein FB562_2298 [Homoserinimonas aerilata]|uniref:Phospholipase D-like protein n=1 Tax=Homoserinimonas aerilata TaxID=1162970 RepID=A0A542YFA2_9MICO|nr:hypothetical protein [Homoserinimonas aerilata]TQL46773.1 hypothetical protein FB562_2298 [Homoserinimonas aerilata]